MVHAALAAAPVLASNLVKQETADVIVAANPLSHFFTQTLYHVLIVPLLLLTLMLAWATRPSTNEEVPINFPRFQRIYLTVWGFCVAADWLQGPYVYALYSAYGFSKNEIAELFVAGFGSSLFFGSFVGAFADRFGRRRCCALYCILYIVSCMTKHCNIYFVLMIGRITGGIATSMLFSCFECWLVCEHQQKNRFSGGLLSYLFGQMFMVMYGTAIIAGFVAQSAADAYPLAPISPGSAIHWGGYCSPFDISILCLAVGFVLITMLWEENFGTSERVDSQGFFDNLLGACRLLFADRCILLVCLVVSSFEGSMFAFVFNWTPALDSKAIPPPHGVIFSLFMMACTCGASVCTMINGRLSPVQRLITTFSMGAVAFMVASYVAGRENYIMIVFGSFLVFEFCCGVYFPSVGVLKSEIVPEHVRGTMYNLYRLPLNGVVVCLLLTHLSLVRCLALCASLLGVALGSIVMVGYKLPKACGELVPFANPSKQI